MKPAPFEYFAPTTLDEALTLLNQHGYDAKVLAGGQSLIPTMNFRLAQPAVLIDLNRIESLFYIAPAADHGVRMGAMTRQRAVERSGLIAQQAPLFTAAMPHIAHAQIRNRGTIGGSLAHADPAAELPAVAVALDARFKLQSIAGERWVNARDFYVGLFTTELEPNEILTEIELPPMQARAGWSIQEVARRHGDYALVGVCAYVTLDESGVCDQAHIVFLSVGEGPTAAGGAQSVLLGERPTTNVIEAVAATAADTDIEPMSDIHASADFRRHLAKVLTKRALVESFARAKG
ncbi:MAG: xanthine dehydrogenase family protein subunit M [Caldilineaceae bacterium]